MNENTLINLDSTSFSELLRNNKDGILLDIRTPMEHQQGHIPGSQILDISNPTFFSELTKLDKEKEYFLYCRSGSRSFTAGNQMLMLGFKNVNNLKAGLLDWKGPLEK